MHERGPRDPALVISTRAGQWYWVPCVFPPHWSQGTSGTVESHLFVGVHEYLL